MRSVVVTSGHDYRATICPDLVWASFASRKAWSECSNARCECQFPVSFSPFSLCSAAVRWACAASSCCSAAFRCSSCMVRPLIGSVIHHVNVGAESWVVRQIPAVVIRIFEDRDGVAIPVPIVDKTVIVRGYVEVKSTEPETIPISPAKLEHMPASKTAREAAVLEGPVHLIMRIVPARVMADPFIVAVDVRSLRMSG